MSEGSDEAFESAYDFNQQREFAKPYVSSHPFIIDWLISMMYELQSKISPFEYATRVEVAQKQFDSVNPEHLAASQRTLQRVVRNLFPYNEVKDRLPDSLAQMLGKQPGQSGKVRKPPYRPLDDSLIESKALVAKRYKILGEAFGTYATGAIKLMGERLGEEEIKDHHTIASCVLDGIKESINQMVEHRKVLYPEFPPERLRHVSDDTLAMEKDLKLNAEMPKDMEPEYVLQTIQKQETIIRAQLNTIVIRAKEAVESIAKTKQVYIDTLAEVLSMAAALKSFVKETDEFYAEIESESKQLKSAIERKFDLTRYLPREVIADVKVGNTQYKNGCI